MSEATPVLPGSTLYHAYLNDGGYPCLYHTYGSLEAASRGVDEALGDEDGSDCLQVLTGDEATLRLGYVVGHGYAAEAVIEGSVWATTTGDPEVVAWIERAEVQA